MKDFKKFGFTLAELMVVFVIIGVLAGVLLPIANSARPDEKVMKFKKSHGTLGNVVRELATSPRYYGDNFTLKKADGNGESTAVSDKKFFCKAFADVVSAKEVNCKDGNTSKPNIDSNDALTTQKQNMDKYCKEVQTSDVTEIVTADGVHWYMANPSLLFNADETDDGFLRYYKVICMDIDDVKADGSTKCVTADEEGAKTAKVDVCPFGFGVRADGKLLTGERADKWTQKAIQKGSKKKD